MQPGVDVQDLVVQYGDVVALQGLDLTLPGGQILGLVGENGAGKTTLLSAIAGLIAPRSGTVRAAGATTLGGLRQAVAYAPDGGFAYRVAIDRIGGLLARAWPGFAADRFDALVERLSLPADRTASALSKGQGARLRLAYALSRPGQVLVLDEPLAGIDPASRDRIADVLAEHLAATGMTAIVATHEVGYLEGLFERVVLLRDGRVAWDEAAEDLRARTGHSVETWLRKECPA